MWGKSKARILRFLIRYLQNSRQKQKLQGGNFCFIDAQKSIDFTQNARRFTLEARLALYINTKHSSIVMICRL